MSILTDKTLRLKKDFDDVFTAGYEKGKAEGGDSEEILFTGHGSMYTRNMTIEGNGADGFYSYAYRYALELETLNVPNIKASYTATSSVFEGCLKLKVANLPNIQRIGINYFNDCAALEEVTLGTIDNPMQEIKINSFYKCPSLVHFNYIGIIPVTITFEHSVVLSKESIATIVNSLSSDASDQTLTLSLAAVNKAFQTSSDANDGSSSSEWQELIATKENWTIVLK